MRRAQSSHAELFPISLSGIAAKSVVDKHVKHLSRTMPSKIELECTRAGMTVVFRDAMKRIENLRHYAVSLRQMGDVAEAELREFAAKEIEEMIAELRVIL